MPGRRGECWRSRWCWRAWTAGQRRRAAGWIVRRCGTGCIATMPRGWPGSATGAGRRGGEALLVPPNITLLKLPPAAPELNPVENVWQYLRSNWLAISVFDDYEAIVKACCTAWNRFAQHPDTVTSITSRSWAKVMHRAVGITRDQSAGFGLHVLQELDVPCARHRVRGIEGPDEAIVHIRASSHLQSQTCRPAPSPSWHARPGSAP